MSTVPHLGALMRLTLPPPSDLDLVRVVLQGPEAAAALQRLLPDLAAPALQHPRLAAQLPLLAAVLRYPGHELPAALAAKLRVAAIHERARCDAIAVIAARAFAALAAAGIEPVVVGGCAIAARYPDPAQRHCHDLDLLVPDLAAAGATLQRADFVPSVDRGNPHAFRDPSGFPIVLRQRASRGQNSTRPSRLAHATTTESWLGSCRLLDAATLVALRSLDATDGTRRAPRALVDVAVLARDLTPGPLAAATADHEASLATWAVLDLLNGLGLDRTDLGTALAGRSEAVQPAQLLLRAVRVRHRRPGDLLAAMASPRDLPAVAMAALGLTVRRPGAVLRRLSAWLRPA